MNRKTAHDRKIRVPFICASRKSEVLIVLISVLGIALRAILRVILLFILRVVLIFVLRIALISVLRVVAVLIVLVILLIHKNAPFLRTAASISSFSAVRLSRKECKNRAANV